LDNVGRFQLEPGGLSPDEYGAALVTADIDQPDLSRRHTGAYRRQLTNALQRQ
jgi:hypothetical protein